MNGKPAPSEINGIDLAFRPTSYFWPLDVETHLLARIKGAERKAMVQRFIDAGRLNEIPGLLTESKLDDAVRQMTGRIHPNYMGGEYLPDLMRNEVMIARITIASSTQDVTSVYANRGRQRIYYRVVDEYQGDTLSGLNRRTSMQPLTLGELETFFNRAWSLFDVLEWNFGKAYDLDEMLDFVVCVESQFYPQIGTLYKRRIEAWAAARRAELDLKQAGESVDSRNQTESNLANEPSDAKLGARSTGPQDASDEQRIFQLIAEDRKRLTSFVRNLDGGGKVDDMSDELRSWWANRY